MTSAGTTIWGSIVPKASRSQPTAGPPVENLIDGKLLMETTVKSKASEHIISRHKGLQLIDRAFKSAPLLVQNVLGKAQAIKRGQDKGQRRTKTHLQRNKAFFTEYQPVKTAGAQKSIAWDLYCFNTKPFFKTNLKVEVN